MRQMLERRLPGCSITPFDWNGSHRQAVRNGAAKRLGRLIEEVQLEHRRIILIGHSNGGNVALMAAYRAPLAPLEIITLNTPFFAGKHASEDEVAERIYLAVGSVGTLLLAVWCFYLLRSPWLIVGFLAFAGWIVVLKSCRSYIGRTLGQGLLARRHSILERFSSAPLRRGARCLVVTHSLDEILAAFNDLRLWIKTFLQTDGRPLPQALGLLSGLVALFVVGQMLLAATNMLAALPATAALLLSALMFTAAAYILLRLIPIIYPMAKYIVAGIALVLVRPLYVVGLSLDGLYVDAKWRGMPAQEPGSRVERFDASDELTERLEAWQTRWDLMSGFGLRPTVYNAVKTLRHTNSEIWTMTAWLYRTARAARHRGVCSNPKVLTRIEGWL